MIDEIIRILDLEDFKSEYKKMDESIYNMIYMYYKLDHAYSVEETEVC